MTSAASIVFRALIIAVVVIVLGIGAYVILKQAELSRSELPVLGAVPDFQFVSQEGRPFGHDDLEGRISVVDFIFTRCQGPCPIMSGHMVELYKLYEETDDIRFVSITVDPDYDSLSVLKAYAEDKGVDDPRWVFLWAPLDSVVHLSETGFMLAAENLPMGHTTKWALVDRDANIRGYYSGTDPVSIEVLKTHI
ncbi:MAG: SCO family protein, partial [Candidatus Zixiibacteriota bacterium]